MLKTGCARTGEPPGWKRRVGTAPHCPLRPGEASATEIRPACVKGIFRDRFPYPDRESRQDRSSLDYNTAERQLSASASPFDFSPTLFGDGQ